MKNLWFILFVFSPLKATMIAQSLSPEARSIWIEATDARDSGHYERALIFFGQALAIAPNHAGLNNSRGKTYFDMVASGLYEAQTDSLLDLAMTDYSAGLRCSMIHDTIKSEILINRGAVYGIQGRFKEALLEFNKGLRVNPKNANGYFNRSIVYYNLENYKKTIADHSHYLKLVPGNANIYYERGMLYRTLGQNKKAVKDLDHALSLKPDFGVAYLERARAYAQIGNTTAAQQDYKQAERLGIKMLATEIEYLNRQ